MISHRLSEEASGSPSDDAERQVQHGDVRLGLLLPAHQDATEAVHPAVGALDDPTVCLLARLLCDLLGLLATPPDMGSEAEFLQQLPNLVILESLVETHALRTV